MFPTDPVHISSAISPTSPTAWYLGHTPSLDGVNLNRNKLNESNLHRRARSDFSGAPAQTLQAYVVPDLTMNPTNEPTTVRNAGSGRRTSQSRIPVSTRPYSSTSDSGQSSQSSRPTTRASQIKITPVGGRADIPRGSMTSVTPKASTSRTQKPASPKRKPQTPLQVKTPKRRDGSVQQAQKSPLLRANIIAPPPKISPPLRSSRPRQTVSAASTAASRAKMVEKIGAMQSPNNSRPSGRRRPPELNNIDFAGRRERITQAFNDAMEEDKRKTQIIERRSQNMTPRPDDSESYALDTTPAIVIEEPLRELVEDDVFMTPAEHYSQMKRPLRVETLSQPSVVDDSPTLGQLEKRPFEELRSLPRFNDTQPLSAITSTTDETSFDPEPQAEISQQTILNHVMQMRSSSPVTPRSLEPSEIADDMSERGDQESIQIMLRDTAYFDDEDEDLPPTHNVLEGLPGQRLCSGTQEEGQDRSSWISSIDDHHSADGKSSTSLSNDGDQACLPDVMHHDGEPINGHWSPASFATPETTHSTVDETSFGNLDERSKAEQALHKNNESHAGRANGNDWSELSRPDNDWISYETTKVSVYEEDDFAPSVPPKDSEATLRPTGIRTGSEGLGLAIRGQKPSFSLQSRSPPPRPPSHSPPPVPPFAAIDATTLAGISPSIYDSDPPSSTFGYAVIPPKIPRRITSLSKIENQQEEQRGSITGTRAPAPSISEERPSFDQPSFTSSKRSSPSPEQRKLRKRRHVIKELMDTEKTFGRDMLVIVDIYKATTSSCAILTQEDVKILFGNSDQIGRFSMGFLDSLKQAGRSVYVMPKTERSKKQSDDQQANRVFPAGTAQTASDDQSSMHDPDIVDAEADRQTSIGKVFKAHIDEMEQVYTQYLKNHNAANRKLQSLQSEPQVEIWLKACYQWADDLTTAWNLDSLLVKPVQRILKYPLLLQSLIEATPEDHPDREDLLEALRDLTRVSTQINEKTKQSDLVNQVLNRKRKDSDVRTGLSKAFGRHTEKLKQNMGISEMVEDSEYNDLKDRYAENFGQLVVVGSDIRKYKIAVTKWVTQLSDFAAAGDGWIDVQQGPWPELESKMRQFAMTVRELAAMALPEHLAAIQKNVLDPMFQAAKMLETLQKDPKGLFQKRDKKLIDYARFRNMKDRGEKLDKKTVERMEQWEALNREAKERMTKLLELTTVLATRCLRSFVDIHLEWLSIWKRKLPPTMNVGLAELTQIEKDWQEDFDFQEASALSMSICNGSLLADAVNMVNFLSPSTTMNGDDSPRQPSWISGNKRSISLNSEGSPALAMGQNHRNSGSFHMPPTLDDVLDRGVSPYANGRLRTTSTTSGPHIGPPEISNRIGSLSTQTTAISTRPSTSAERKAESSQSSQQFPRLSFDPPSPMFGPPRTESPTARPESSSTFFSTNAGPSHAITSPAGQQPGTFPSARSSPVVQPTAVFSSAMPMSDSPMSTEFPQVEEARHFAVLFTCASIYEFNIDRARRDAGFSYLTYVAGEVFDVIGERGELWLARNQDDPQQQIGWIWHKHFSKLEE